MGFNSAFKGLIDICLSPGLLVMCLCGRRQSAPSQSEVSVFACLKPAYIAKRLQLLQVRMRRRRGCGLAGLWEDRDGMRYINLCFPVILILSTHEVRDSIVIWHKHFPHLSRWKAIKIFASQYYVTAASFLSNPRTIRPTEFSCLCRKATALVDFSFLNIQVSVMLRRVKMFRRSLLTNLWIRKSIRLSETSVAI